jgi:hypothetical protein
MNNSNVPLSVVRINSPRVRSGHLVRIRDSDSNGGFRIAAVQLTSRNFSDRHTAAIGNGVDNDGNRTKEII